MNVPVTIATIFPMPQEASAVVKFDALTVVKLMLMCRVLASLMCFLVNNKAYQIFSKRGFFNQCRQVGFEDGNSKKRLRGWAGRTRWSVYNGIAVCLAKMALLSVLLCTEGGAKTMDGWMMMRAWWWLGLPRMAITTLIISSEMLAEAQFCFYATLYWGLVDLVRIHFRALCKSMGAESAGTFNTGHIDKYHAEYARLVSMAQLLDKAFRMACLSQMCLIIITSCISLFFFTKSDVQLRELLFLCAIQFLMVGLFACTVIPAIRMKGQVSGTKFFS